MTNSGHVDVAVMRFWLSAMFDLVTLHVLEYRLCLDNVGKTNGLNVIAMLRAEVEAAAPVYVKAQPKLLDILICK
jgi:hypothetical protein